MADQQYDNELKGVLFRNEKRRPDDPDTAKLPVLKGRCQIEGKTYWVAAFVRVGKQGKTQGQKFWSLTFTPADVPAEPAAPGGTTPTSRASSERKSSPRQSTSRGTPEGE